MEAEARGFARVVLLDLEDRMVVAQGLSGLAIARRGLGSNTLADCTEALASIRDYQTDVVLRIPADPGQCRAVLKRAPPRPLPTRASPAISWTRSERRVLASRMSTEDWVALVTAARSWETFIDRRELFRAGVVQTSGVAVTGMQEVAAFRNWLEHAPDFKVPRTTMGDSRLRRAIPLLISAAQPEIALYRGIESLRRYAG